MTSNNPNRCAECVGKAPQCGMAVADTGYCGSCGFLNEVWDTELLAHYQKRGLDQIEVCASYPLSLPRLRSSHNPNNSVLPRSMAEIDQEIARVAQIKADAKTQ